MKKYFYLAGIVILLVVGLSFTGCKDRSSPAEVVERYYKAIDTADAQTILELATPETAELILIFGDKMQGLISARGEIISYEETITGRNAVVTVTFNDGFTQDEKLVKVKGEWKVTFGFSLQDALE